MSGGHWHDVGWVHGHFVDLDYSVWQEIDSDRSDTVSDFVLRLVVVAECRVAAAVDSVLLKLWLIQRIQIDFLLHSVGCLEQILFLLQMTIVLPL